MNHRSAEAVMVAISSFILFPCVLATFIMTFINSANHVLIDISFSFSLVIAIVSLTCTIICFKYRSSTKQPKKTKIFSIINIITTSLMCLIGILEISYCFGIVFPYILILLDILFVAYIPIAIVTLFNFIMILIFQSLADKKSHHKTHP